MLIHDVHFVSYGKLHDSIHRGVTGRGEHSQHLPKGKVKPCHLIVFFLFKACVCLTPHGLVARREGGSNLG